MPTVVVNVKCPEDHARDYNITTEQIRNYLSNQLVKQRDATRIRLWQREACALAARGRKIPFPSP